VVGVDRVCRIVAAHDKNMAICVTAGSIENGAIIKTKTLDLADKSYQFYLRSAPDAILNCPSMSTAKAERTGNL
jgi:hypothetical protein